MMFKTSVQKQGKKIEAIKTEEEFVKIAKNMETAKGINFGKIADSVDETLKDTEKAFKESLEEDDE